MTDAEATLLRFTTSPGPWTVRPYDDGAPYLAIVDVRGNEVCCLESDRAGATADAEAIVWEKNKATPFPELVSSPRPWHVEPCAGRKDEEWLVILAADGTEVLIAPRLKQATIDLLWIVAAMNVAAAQ